MANILVVDDEKDIRELLGDILEDEGHDLTKVGHAQDALDKADQLSFDLVVLDIWLKESHMDGIDILKYIKNRHPDLPVVIISGHGNVEIAVAAIKQGAFDFIEKPFNIDQLLVVVNRALELSHLRRAKRQGKMQSQENVQLVGSSNVMRTLKSQIKKLAQSQTRVLFSGPSGVGKEVCARHLHECSVRADQPFISVNSATLNAEDMERQVFGYEEGGRIYQGLLERANGGTLYFDEIADLPIETQGKMLRLVNDQSFVRVGGSQTISVDVRFVSATKLDLTQEIEEGNFREELFHRLAVAPLEVPPLKKRVEDMAELVTHLSAEYAKRENLPQIEFSEEAIQILQSMPWNGNVRELKNYIERIMILNPEVDMIGADEIGNRMKSADESELDPAYLLLPLREARELFETHYINAQINRFSGNVSRTANFIKMERSALHRKMKSLDIGGQS